MGIWLEGLAALCLSPTSPARLCLLDASEDLSSSHGFEVNLAVWGDTQWRGRKGCLWLGHVAGAGSVLSLGV